MRWLRSARQRAADTRPFKAAELESAALAADVDCEAIKSFVYRDLVSLIPRPYTDAQLVANVAAFVEGPITLVDLDVPPTAKMSGLWNPTTRELFLSPHYESAPRTYALCHELCHIIRNHKATLGSRDEMYVAMEEATGMEPETLEYIVGMMHNDGSLTRCRNFGTHDEYEAEYMGTVIGGIILNPPPSSEVSYIRRALR